MLEALAAQAGVAVKNARNYQQMATWAAQLQSIAATLGELRPLLAGIERALIEAEGGTVEADVVVAGVGSAPETSLAETAGIQTADGITRLLPL